MGSSGESNSNTNEIDASVGGLVWVRRRNGSWWPGRIMGLDELSESCLVSPRSGTPVKLLGREDASVDWYNLEKSKRVKAFRCGEYNECIERAKASAANANKKAVKYARREDAILHALELESARLGKEPLNFSRADKSGSEHGVVVGESPDLSNSVDKNDDVTDDLSDSEDNSNSAPELSQSVISFEEPNHNGSSKMQSVQGRRRRTPNDSEDDGTEGVKRMRGLEDLGIGVMSKRKVQGAGTTDIVQQEAASLSNSNNRNCLANGTSVNGGKVYSSALKRKRSQVANVHEFLKRKNRRRPLTKVLESTAMVSVPVVCDQLPNPTSSPLCGISDGGGVSGLDSNGSKKIFPPAIQNSDGTGVACENGTASNVHGHGCDSPQISHRVKENETPGISGLAGNDSSDKLFDVPFVGDVGEEKRTPGLSPGVVSCPSENPRDGALGEQSCHVSQPEALSLINEGQNDSGCMSLAADHNNINHREEKGSSKWQSKGKRNSRHKSKNTKQVSRNYLDIDGESSAYLAGMENFDEFSQGACQKVDWNTTGAPTSSCHSPSQTNCKSVADGPSDSFRSLSKHIKGTTEAKLLPDGSLTPQRSLPYRQSRFTVNSRYQMADFPGRSYCSDASLYDVKIEVKASYRPQHVPLVSLMSKLNGKAIVGHPLTVEALDDGCCDEMLSGIASDLPVGDNYCALKPNSASGRIPSKKLSRLSSKKSSRMKKSGLLNKKIRKLSSLTGHRQSEEESKPVVDKFKGPVIACIPLKVVFSRINEAVNGQARPTQRGLPPSNP